MVSERTYPWDTSGDAKAPNLEGRNRVRGTVEDAAVALTDRAHLDLLPANDLRTTQIVLLRALEETSRLLDVRRKQSYSARKAGVL